MNVLLLFCFSLFLPFTDNRLTEGFYYTTEGTFLGRVGEKYQVYLSSETSFDSLLFKKQRYIQHVGRYKDVMTLAACNYAETYANAEYYERVGIVWAILNNNTAQRSDFRSPPETLEKTALRIAHVTNNDNPRYQAFWDELPFCSSPDASLAMKATLLAMTNNEPDVSEKAVFWEGANSLVQQHRWNMEKFAKGFEILPEHRKDRPLKSKEWLEFGPDGWWTFYRYQSTAAIGQTVFCRIHPDFARTFHPPTY